MDTVTENDQKIRALMAQIENEQKSGVANAAGPIRKFETGATRDTDNGKFDYEGFLCPRVLWEYGNYMHQHRRQANGELRDSDNWQKGIPKNVYVKSMVRHVFQVWTIHRGYSCVDEKGNEVTMKSALCAVVFNCFGHLFEILRGE